MTSARADSNGGAAGVWAPTTQLNQPAVVETMLYLAGDVEVRLYRGYSRRVDELRIGDTLHVKSIDCPYARIEDIAIVDAQLYEVRPMWSAPFTCGAGSRLTIRQTCCDGDVVWTQQAAYYKARRGTETRWPWYREWSWPRRGTAGGGREIGADDDLITAHIARLNRECCDGDTVAVEWCAGTSKTRAIVGAPARWSIALERDACVCGLSIGAPIDDAEAYHWGNRLHEDGLRKLEEWPLSAQRVAMLGVIARCGRRYGAAQGADAGGSIAARRGHYLRAGDESRWQEYYVLTLPTNMIGLIERLARVLGLVYWRGERSDNHLVLLSGDSSQFFETDSEGISHTGYVEPVVVTSKGLGKCYMITLDEEHPVFLADGVVLPTQWWGMAW